jgi:hypothetical protein
MINWVKEVNNEKYWKLLIRCLLKSTEEIPTRPTEEGWNQIPRPQPEPAPCPMPEQRRQQRQRASRRTRRDQSSKMSRIYHPDKHNSGFTGKSDEEAVEFFQFLNNAHSYLREIM